MNGKQAKRLRGRFGHKTQAYRAAKRAFDTMPTSFAQRAKPLAQRAPKRREASAPSWPGTADQQAQSRPLVVVKPYRATAARARTIAVNRLVRNPRRLSATGRRQVYGAMPKWWADRLATHGEGLGRPA